MGSLYSSIKLHITLIESSMGMLGYKDITSAVTKFVLGGQLIPLV